MNIKIKVVNLLKNIRKNVEKKMHFVDAMV